MTGNDEDDHDFNPLDEPKTEGDSDLEGLSPKERKKKEKEAKKAEKLAEKERKRKEKEERKNRKKSIDPDLEVKTEEEELTPEEAALKADMDAALAGINLSDGEEYEGVDLEVVDIDVFGTKGQVQGIGFGGESAFQRGVLRHFDTGCEKVGKRLGVLQVHGDHEVLLSGLLGFLEGFKVICPLGDLHIMGHILLEGSTYGGEIHLTGHAEVKEVAVHTDTFLETAVIDDGGFKVVHGVLFPVFLQQEVLDGQGAFGLVEVVEILDVGLDCGMFKGEGAFFDDIELAHVGLGDGGDEVTIHGLGVVEVEPAAEVEDEFVVVDVYLAVEALVFQVAVQGDFVNGVSQDLGIAGVADDVEFQPFCLALLACDMGHQVKAAHFVRCVGEDPHVESLRFDVAFEDPVVTGAEVHG